MEERTFTIAVFHLVPGPSEEHYAAVRDDYWDRLLGRGGAPLAVLGPFPSENAAEAAAEEWLAARGWSAPLD